MLKDLLKNKIEKLDLKEELLKVKDLDNDKISLWINLLNWEHLIKNLNNIETIAIVWNTWSWKWIQLNWMINQLNNKSNNSFYHIYLNENEFNKDRKIFKSLQITPDNISYILYDLLKDISIEIKRRENLLAQYNAKDINMYIKMQEINENMEKLDYLNIIIDEYISLINALKSINLIDIEHFNYMFKRLINNGRYLWLRLTILVHEFNTNELWQIKDVLKYFIIGYTSFVNNKNYSEEEITLIKKDIKNSFTFYIPNEKTIIQVPYNL